MDNIYMLTDMVILTRIGEKLKAVRLKQNITQQSLAEAANVSLSDICSVYGKRFHTDEAMWDTGSQYTFLSSRIIEAFRARSLNRAMRLQR